MLNCVTGLLTRYILGFIKHKLKKNKTRCTSINIRFRVDKIVFLNSNVSKSINKAKYLHQSILSVE